MADSVDRPDLSLRSQIVTSKAADQVNPAFDQFNRDREPFGDRGRNLLGHFRLREACRGLTYFFTNFCTALPTESPTQISPAGLTVTE